MYTVMVKSVSEFTVRARADAGHSCIIFLIVRPFSGLIRAMRGLGVPHAPSVIVTNDICRTEHSPVRYPIGACIGAQLCNADLTTQNMAATLHYFFCHIQPCLASSI